MVRRMLSARTVLLLLAGWAAGCGPTPGDPMTRTGDEIVAAGRFFHTGTPVVLWLDPDGYNAYKARQHFDATKIMPDNPADPDSPSRYSPTRRDLAPDLKARVDEEGWTLDNLQQQVDQFVLHYDVCGTSARCFFVLQDLRGLSVHFMLDIDGTIYQTLDLSERAWHAGSANNRSVGIEIAHIGAYPKLEGALEEWYDVDKDGRPVVTLPEEVAERFPVGTPDFVGRSARKELLAGRVNGRDLVQYDFTEEQYRALIKLTAALHRIFPKLELDYPRDEQGCLVPNVLTKDEREAFSGIMAHWHVIKSKIDPGPAFDWDRVITGARRQLGM